MAFLIQANEGVKSVVVPLGRALILVGRDPDSSIYLDDTSVSKNHASIVFSGGAHVLRDNGSSNGTFVNGNPVREHKLAHGDTISFGPYTFIADLVNPMPAAGVPSGSGFELERAGQSYSRAILLPGIPGSEPVGELHLAVSGLPEQPPPPLPAAGFLENLGAEDRQNLARHGNYHFARGGEVLIKEGENSGRLFFLISGKCEARKENPAMVIAQIPAGEWVGEVNIFDPAGAVCSVVALEHCEYWEITRGAFETFINESRGAGSAILVSLAATLGRRIRQSNGALQQAVATARRPARSKWTLPLAAAATLATLAAAWFFLWGAADKNRLQAENQKAERNRVETLGEARARIESLQASLDGANAELALAKAGKADLEAQLASLRRAPLVPPPPAATPAAEPANPGSRVQSATPPPPPPPAAPEPGLPPYPAKVAVLQKTTLSVQLDGKVSGKVSIPAGRELVVAGTNGTDVLVEFGNTVHALPKSSTDFDAALEREAAAARGKAKPKPSPATQVSAPKPPPTPKVSKPAESPVPAPTTGDIALLLEEARILDSLEEIRNLRSAPQQESARVMRSLAARWKRASEGAARLLSGGNGSPEHTDLLKKFLEAAEIADPNRIQVFEAKLNEIDAAWIKIKTGEKIQTLTENPNPAGGQ